MKTKKLLSILLSILMLTGVFAVNASAVDEIGESDVYVAGTLISEGYYLVADGGITAENATAENYNVKFTPATASANAKLTLNNAKALSKTIDFDSATAVVLSGGNLDVELIGENTITGGAVAFASVGNLNFIGNGSISFSSDEEYCYFTISSGNISVGDKAQFNLNTPELQPVYGFITEQGTVTIKDNANINMRITGYGIYSAGLTVCDNAQLTVDSANTDGAAVNIYYGNVSINDNAVVNLSTTRKVDGLTNDDTSCALSVKCGHLAVTGNAQLNASAGGGYQNAVIYLEGTESNRDLSITVSDYAKVNATASDTTASTYGIFIDNATQSVLTVKDSAEIFVRTGNMTVGEDDSSYGVSGCCGVLAEEIVVSDNAKLESLTGLAFFLDDNTKMNGDCFAIYTENLTVSDSAIVKGKASKGKGRSIGVNSINNIKVTGDAKLEGIGGSTAPIDDGNGSEECIGIYAKNLLEMKDNASVHAVGGMANSFSYSISANNIDMSGHSVISAASNNTNIGQSVSIMCRNSINAQGYSSIVCYSGISKNNSSFGISAKNLSATDNVYVEGTGCLGSNSYGIYIEEATVLSGNARIDAGACDATVTACGFYSKNFTSTDNVYILAEANNACNSFGFAVDTSEISGSTEIIGKSSDGIDKSVGVYLYNGATIGSDCYISGDSLTATTLASGIYSNGNLSISGNASLIGKALDAEKCYGIASANLTASDTVTLEASGETQAIYCTVFNIDNYNNPHIVISRNSGAEHKEDWDGTSALGGESSPYKYVLIAPEAPEEPESELSFFEQLLADIASFFNSIIEFFTSLFSLVG